MILSLQGSPKSARLNETFWFGGCAAVNTVVNASATEVVQVCSERAQGLTQP